MALIRPARTYVLTRQRARSHLPQKLVRILVHGALDCIARSCVSVREAEKYGNGLVSHFDARIGGEDRDQMRHDVGCTKCVSAARLARDRVERDVTDGLDRIGERLHKDVR